MVSHKLIVRLHAAPTTVQPADFLPVFHRWIQQQVLPDSLPVDVADYAHVPGGPGTLLVCDEANIHIDRSDGSLGLTYVRKRPVPGATTLTDVIEAVVTTALDVARLLEAETGLPEPIRFDTSGLTVRFNDRLAFPNDAETIVAVGTGLRTVAARHGWLLQPVAPASAAASLQVRLAAPPSGVD